MLAIWGRETAFGAHRSPHYAIKVLATQAYLGRRKDMFRNELLHALKMLQDGVRTRETLTSSWAGAMGLPQLMPSEFYTLAYDLDGDGRKRHLGARSPMPWDRPPISCAPRAGCPTRAGATRCGCRRDISCLSEGPDNAKPVREWVKAGVVRVAGEFPAQALDQQAFVLAPAGAHGPAFLALENFLVFKRYNMSDLYALFVGNLGDRMVGGGDFRTPWGDVRQLSAKGIEEIQDKLQALGYAVAKIDGKAGMNTRSLIGAYQKANSLKIDCWPTEALLEHVRVKTPAKGAEAGKGGTRGEQWTAGSTLASPWRWRYRSWPARHAPSRTPLAEARAFIDKLWPAAQARGISRALFERATADFIPDPEVLALAMLQPEHAKPAGAYVTGLVRQARVETGRQFAATHAELLEAIEAAYGVDRHILLAIWGVEFGVRDGDGLSRRHPLAGDAGHGGHPARAVLDQGADRRATHAAGRRRPARRSSSALGPAPWGTPSSFPRPTPRAPWISTRTAGVTSGGRWPTPWPRPPTTCGHPAGSLAAQWGFEVALPPSFDFAWSAPGRGSDAMPNGRLRG